MKIKEAREALTVSKVRQAEHANKRRSDEDTSAVSDLVHSFEPLDLRLRKSPVLALR